MVLLEVNSTLL